MVLRWARGCIAHRGAGLGQEVLHDGFLHVAVLPMRCRDGLECRDAVGAGLADAHEDAGGERHACPAGRVQGGQTPLGCLVGGATVAGQVAAQRLQHHPLAGRHLRQQAQFVLRQRAGVGVRQQPGLGEHELRHRVQVVHGAVVPLLAQPGASHLVAIFGRLAQCEQRLVAPHASAVLRDAQHLLGREVRRGQPSRRLRERAVAALVAAQHGERDEHLRRVADASAVRGVAHPSRSSQEFVERQRQQIVVRHGPHHNPSQYQNRTRTASPSPLRPCHRKVTPHDVGA